jgi:hypothetical protein
MAIVGRSAATRALITNASNQGAYGVTVSRPFMHKGTRLACEFAGMRAYVK